ncbi:MAG: hypothetical protein JO046_12515 [Solirubrobacterales bacterium]|nr:hypothetical protein [Solirubrobacterales bacterium]
MDVDELYGLPLDEFVPARNALARELRNSGRREDAAEVAALRKPSVAAWAVNQLVRTQRRAVADLFEAGDGLRDAHDHVMRGSGDGSSLRDAVEGERGAVESLVGAARGLLTSDGHELSPTIIDRVADTLHAAALDGDARAQVQNGRLERELRHVGLGMAVSSGAAPAPAPRAPARARRGRSASAGEAQQRAEDRAAAERAAREQAEARASARATEREARRRLERAQRAANAAAERRERAAQALEAAEAELADLQSEVDEAQAQLHEAERAIRDLAG